ncbi:hypothetical protein [Roseivirga sp. E12]|uniref:hypothetical protein n=1 Tax=Roseivirga sp. E12 TaxID=2819237 RepID=UPI001ABC8C72|nr:hypothetical protein [Roseivirga sp. E12]MBO3696965.1 hypothetical protein [Roseivirga sp. E12]
MSKLPPPPNAVRVWRGYRSPSLEVKDFYDKLSTVFVPATVEMQTPIGLCAYIPTIPCDLADKPDTVPDETAILYWESQDTYHNGFNTLGVRTYTLTHGSVYTDESRADFPTFFNGALTSEQPCYLIDKAVDWMRGEVRHLVAGKPSALSSDEFMDQVAKIMTEIQSEASVDGAVICVGDDYLVYWELGQESAGYSKLQALVGWQLDANPAPNTLTAKLWDDWSGMKIKPGSSFNMQFKRDSYEYACPDASG